MKAINNTIKNSANLLITTFKKIFINGNKL
uniref:Uncharacterized protein n=1 Tax=Microviridae sp. ctNWS1 TaxID=2826733 RepID=A0A8S5N505_9VIRU|nr:MAG TPA: hypothetical protein [Microviridae sp. ctNWS1]